MPVLQCLLDGAYYFLPLSLCSSSIYMLCTIILCLNQFSSNILRILGMVF